MVSPFGPCTVITSPSAFGEYSPVFSGRAAHFAFTQAVNGSTARREVPEPTGTVLTSESYWVTQALKARAIVTMVNAAARRGVFIRQNLLSIINATPRARLGAQI